MTYFLLFFLALVVQINAAVINFDARATNSGPDPAQAVSVSLNGQTYINKVLSLRIHFMEVLNSPSGTCRIWPHSLRLQGVNGGHTWRNRKCHCSQAQIVVAWQEGHFQRDVYHAARSWI